MPNLKLQTQPSPGLCRVLSERDAACLLGHSVALDFSFAGIFSFFSVFGPFFRFPGQLCLNVISGYQAKNIPIRESTISKLKTANPKFF
jgi:hypothetical protein